MCSMITDYIKLDAERFVKDYYFYREQIPRSQKELDDMDGLSAIRYDRQPGNKTFDDSGIYRGESCRVQSSSDTCAGRQQDSFHRNRVDTR